MREIRDVSCCVVGGAGFLGSHMVDALIERGCRVLVIDNLCAGRREFVHKEATFFHADITSSEHCLATVFLQHGVEYVFNYAAWPYVPSSFARPVHVCDVNFMGALHVINAAQDAGVKAILQVSSAEIYGSEMRVVGNFGDDETPGLTPIERPRTSEFAGHGRMSEEYAVEPHSSYGVSKAAVDAFVQVAWRERRTPCIALRQFNCLGRRDALHPYIVPEIIGQLMQLSCSAVCTRCFTVRNMADPPCSRCGGTNIDPEYSATVKLGNDSFRDFLDAEDAVRMAVELLERGQFGEVYNLGSQSGVKMYDLARMIGEVIGFRQVRVERDEARVRPWEIWHLQSDSSKLYSVIEARPTISLETSLKNMVEWYKENAR